MLRVFLLLFMRRHGIWVQELDESLFDGTAEIWLLAGLLDRGAARLCGAVR